MSVDWGYFDKFEWADEKYLPCRGEGETKATQIVTAINKLVYKWYNDGDVFDNTHYLIVVGGTIYHLMQIGWNTTQIKQVTFYIKYRNAMMMGIMKIY